MHQNKINLLHLVTGLGVGGAERVVLDLAKNADTEKYNVSVVSMSKKIEMLDEFQRNRIGVSALEKDNNIKAFFQIILFLKGYVKQHEIKVIHAHMTHSIIAAATVKLLNPKIKIVFTSHSISFASKKVYRSKMISFFYSLATGIFRKISIYLLKPFRNKDILFSNEQVSSIYRRDFLIIPNGIDIDAYQIERKKFDPFTFLAVGRLEHVKNHIRLLECAVELKNKKYTFQILIAGEGDQREKLEKYILDNHLEGNVTLLGLRSDIAELMAKSHAFVMPSLWEGLPIVLLEAGATGLPVISTPVGAIPSLIEKANGYLVNEDNFCNMMEYTLTHYTEAEQKAFKLHTKVIEKYSINRIVNKHEAVYAGLVEDEA